MREHQGVINGVEKLWTIKYVLVTIGSRYVACLKTAVLCVDCLLIKVSDALRIFAHGHGGSYFC